MLGLTKHSNKDPLRIINLSLRNLLLCNNKRRHIALRIFAFFVKDA